MYKEKKIAVVVPVYNSDMPRLLDPVADGQVEYARGNRLLTGKAWDIIPK